MRAIPSEKRSQASRDNGKKGGRAKLVIVKVQLPIASSDDNAGVLIYSEDKSFMEEIPFRDVDGFEIMQKPLGIFSKAYFYAKLGNNGEITIVRKAPWQVW